MSPLPQIQPARLTSRDDPIDHPNWLAEIKMDGFRCVLYLDSKDLRLVSRKGYVFRKFPRLSESILDTMRIQSAILDGEIVSLDAGGRPVFLDLLWNRGEPRYYAFDLLYLNGVDLRHRPLLERKRRLRAIIPKEASHLLYLDHVSEGISALWDLARREDLEGIVCKPKTSPYPSADPWWVKIKNPKYSQEAGRRELFGRMRKASSLL